MSEGTLIIVVMKAKNLPNRRKLEKQNPFCCLRLGNEDRRSKAIIRGGQRPNWNYEERYEIDTETSPILKVAIFDETKKESFLICDAEIDISPVFKESSKKGYDKWYPLQYAGRSAGEIYIQMTFYESISTLKKSVRSRHTQMAQIELPMMHKANRSSERQKYNGNNSNRVDDDNYLMIPSSPSRASRPSRPLPLTPNRSVNSSSEKDEDNEGNDKFGTDLLATMSISDEEEDEEFYRQSASRAAKYSTYFDELNPMIEHQSVQPPSSHRLPQSSHHYQQSLQHYPQSPHHYNLQNSDPQLMCQYQRSPSPHRFGKQEMHYQDAARRYTTRSSSPQRRSRQPIRTAQSPSKETYTYRQQYYGDTVTQPQSHPSIVDFHDTCGSMNIKNTYRDYASEFLNNSFARDIIRENPSQFKPLLDRNPDLYSYLYKEFKNGGESEARQKTLGINYEKEKNNEITAQIGEKVSRNPYKANSIDQLEKELCLRTSDNDRKCTERKREGISKSLGTQARNDEADKVSLMKLAGMLPKLPSTYTRSPERMTFANSNGSESSAEGDIYRSSGDSYESLESGYSRREASRMPHQFMEQRKKGFFSNKEEFPYSPDAIDTHYNKSIMAKSPGAMDFELADVSQHHMCGPSNDNVSYIRKPPPKEY